MKQSLFMVDKNSICLATIALVLNICFFLANYHNNYYLGLLLAHGEIGYNFATRGSIKLNKERYAHIRALEISQNRMIDHAEVDHTPFGDPTEDIASFDTPWYGLILGLLWSCTQSFCYHDIQILQIIIFSLLMFLIYGLALLLFQKRSIAFVIGLCHLLFLPLTYQNVQVLRDIWVYYALVILLWSLAAYYKRAISLPAFAGCIALFSYLELVRPPVIYSFILTVFFFTLVGFLQESERYRWWKAVGVMVCTNALFFWAPYVTYNKITYGRSIVSSWGLLLLEGLGEYENPWGFQLNDKWAAQYLQEKYNVFYGTVPFSDKAKEEFFKALKEKPSHFIISILRRLPSMLLPALPWTNYFLSPSNVGDGHSWWDKILRKLAEKVSSWGNFYDFFGRHIMVRLFLILGYLGFFLMIAHGEYFAALFLTLVGILPAYHCIISHIEYRYIITFYAFFSFGVGYLMVILRDIWCNRRLTSIKEG